MMQTHNLVRAALNDHMKAAFREKRYNFAFIVKGPQEKTILEKIIRHESGETDHKALRVFDTSDMEQLINDTRGRHFQTVFLLAIEPNHDAVQIMRTKMKGDDYDIDTREMRFIW